MVKKVIEIDVDVLNAQGGIEGLKTSFQEATKETESLRTQMRKAQQEVAELSEKFGATSKEAVNAAKKAAELKDRIGDAKTLTDAFNPDAKFKSLTGALTGVAGGFSVVTGAMGTLGVESESTQDALLKVQSAMALASGAQAVGESVDAFKQLGAVVKSFSIVQKAITAGQWLWNIAMTANPIGAIVAVVTALIVAGYKLVQMFMDSSEATQKAEEANKALNAELDKQVKAQKSATQEAELSREAQLKMAKASGKSAEEIRKLSEQLANQEVAQKYANAQTLRAIAIEALRVAGLEDATDAQKETAQKALKEFNDANDLLKTAILNRRKLAIDNRVAEKQEETDARNEKIKAQKEANEKAIENEKREQEKRREELKKQREQDVQDLKDFQAKIREAETEERLKVIDERFAQAEIDLQWKTELAEASDKIDAEYKQKELEREKALAEGKKAIQQSTMQVIEGGISVLKGVFEKNKAIQKGAMMVESALGIAKIIVNTQTANAVAMASPINAVDPTYGARMRVINMISAGIGIASNISATAKALSALGGGGAPSAGSTGGGGGGGVKGAAGAFPAS